MHPSVTAILRHFRHDHLPPHLAEVSKSFGELAQRVAQLGDDPEVTMALRKLLEAKDCAVRAVVVAGQ